VVTCHTIVTRAHTHTHTHTHAPSGKCMSTLDGHDDEILDVCFNATGRYNTKYPLFLPCYVLLCTLLDMTPSFAPILPSLALICPYYEILEPCTPNSFTFLKFVFFSSLHFLNSMNHVITTLHSHQHQSITIGSLLVSASADSTACLYNTMTSKVHLITCYLFQRKSNEMSNAHLICVFDTVVHCCYTLSSHCTYNVIALLLHYLPHCCYTII
jgi:WD40 repeat protein